MPRNFFPTEYATAFKSPHILKEVPNVPEGSRFQQRQAPLPRAEADDDRDARRGGDGADVPELFRAADAQLHQARSIRAARADRLLCAGPGVRRGGLPDQEPDQPVLYDHRRRGRAFQLPAGRDFRLYRRDVLPAHGRTARRADRFAGGRGDDGGAVGLYQLFRGLSYLHGLHADGRDPGDVSGDQSQRQKPLGRANLVQHALHLHQGADLGGHHLPDLQKDQPDFTNGTRIDYNFTKQQKGFVMSLFFYETKKQREVCPRRHSSLC